MSYYCYLYVGYKKMGEMRKYGVTLDTIRIQQYLLDIGVTSEKYQMILEKIKADADAVSLDGDRILLYHGSKSGIVGEIAPKSREMCDFGKGFYMGTDPCQPLTLICDFEKSKFYVVSVDMKNLDTIEIKAALD